MIYPAGTVHSDGGVLFVYVGSPNVGVQWTLTGHGTLTTFGDKTDLNGVACARYNPTAGTPAQPGDSITVRVDAYA